jgi:AbrB family looped-hinge helix DNA binding protein
MYRSFMTQKGQVTIPVSMRNSLDLHTGDEIEFILQGEEVLLRKHTQPVEELFGLFSVSHAVSDEDIEGAIIKGATRAHRS